MTLIDTHAHLQFKAFEGKVDEVIKSAKDAGVEKIIVVGTNLETSKKAVTLAQKYENVYASVGIHPHHVFSYCHSQRSEESVKGMDSSYALGMTTQIITQLETLLSHPKVIAIGETGLDRHIYQKSHYQNYQITEKFIELQKLFFKEQIKLAIKHKKSLITHNREAVPELLEILETNWDPSLKNRSVFHCCEPDRRLLEFAKKHKVFIGIDGDITYDKNKQNFVKHIPQNLLVLETDSPYFTPEPLKSQNIKINEPKNLRIIAEFIAKLKEISFQDLTEITAKNSKQIFTIMVESRIWD